MPKEKGSVWGSIGLAALGAAAGAVAGMLVSPKSGKQNRAVVAKETKKAVRRVSATAKAAKKKVAAKKK